MHATFFSIFCSVRVNASIYKHFDLFSTEKKGLLVFIITGSTTDYELAQTCVNKHCLEHESKLTQPPPRLKASCSFFSFPFWTCDTKTNLFSPLHLSKLCPVWQKSVCGEINNIDKAESMEMQNMVICTFYECYKQLHEEEQKSLN